MTEQDKEIQELRREVSDLRHINYLNLAEITRLRREVERLDERDVVPARDYRDCRNELCLQCGRYKERHLGACDGCRWNQ